MNRRIAYTLSKPTLISLNTSFSIFGLEFFQSSTTEEKVTILCYIKLYQKKRNTSLLKDQKNSYTNANIQRLSKSIIQLLKLKTKTLTTNILRLILTAVPLQQRIALLRLQQRATQRLQQSLQYNNRTPSTTLTESIVKAIKDIVGAVLYK